MSRLSPETLAPIAGLIASGAPGDRPAVNSPALEVQRQKAERLLLYAAEAGVDVEANVREDILNGPGSTDDTQAPSAARFLAALTKLASKLRPVTAESLQACADARQVDGTVSYYRKMAIWLGLVLIPISVATFVITSISDATLKDIDAANALAVKLSEEIGPPQSQPAGGIRGNPDKLPRGVKEFDVIRDLQTFAGKARAIDARAKRLDGFVFGIVEDPFKTIRQSPEAMRRKFDLPSDLPDLSVALTERITNYQQVRHFAESVREVISTFYGAVAVGILPVMYALLGALAYLLRSYQEQIKSRTFTNADTHVARFVIAAIGGGVVGLFKNFTSGDEASISPLAIAFLVGYAADVFFSFLDSFVQTFNRGSGAPKT